MPVEAASQNDPLILLSTRVIMLPVSHQPSLMIDLSRSSSVGGAANGGHISPQSSRSRGGSSSSSRSISPDPTLDPDANLNPTLSPSRRSSSISLSTLASIKEEGERAVVVTSDLSEAIRAWALDQCSECDDENGVDGVAPLSAMEAIPEACFLEMAKFLKKNELYRLSQASSICAAGALDEAVWRALTMRTFPTRGREEPIDFLWRAEFKALDDAGKRERAYMNALSQGRTGLRKGIEPPERLVSTLRFSAHEGNKMRAARAAARAAQAAQRAAALVAKTTAAVASGATGGSVQAISSSVSGGAFAHLAELDAAASKPHVPIRQGTMSWPQLGGIGMGEAAARTAL